MARLTEFYLDSCCGANQLHTMEWLPDSGVVRGVLQLTHGIVEHIARYAEFACFMAEHGFAVIGYSLPGHGRSAANQADKGFFAEKDGWDLAVSDMYALYETERSKYPGIPYFLLGHSMGSFLARSFLIKYQTGLAGCILSGTGQQSGLLLNAGLAAAAIEKRLHGVRYQSARLNSLSFGSYNAHIRPQRTPYDWLSRDEFIVDRYMDDEDCGFVPAVGLFIDMLTGLKFIGNRKNVSKMRKDIPILFISGEQDPVGEYGKGLQRAYALMADAGCSDLTLKMYPGARHEILNELNRQEVYQDILEWMMSKITA
jgi:alpha-beta hydrolase superfamily lysophospholipase